jgi:hypothetical protein
MSGSGNKIKRAAAAQTFSAIKGFTFAWVPIWRAPPPCLRTPRGKRARAQVLYKKVDFLMSLYTNFPPCSLRARRLDKCCEREKEAHHNLSALSHAGFYIIPAFFPDSETSPLFIRLHGAVPRINYVEQQCLSSGEKKREKKICI